MDITVLGTGAVGRNLSAKLSELEHTVTMGTRDPKVTRTDINPNKLTGESFSDWYQSHNAIKVLTFNESCQSAELVINATGGLVGKENLKGKTLLDVANPLDFSNGFPPFLSVCNTESLAENIQNEFKETKVIKSLNTMNTAIMTYPESISSEHNVFICGNANKAKETVLDLLIEIGWKKHQIIDLGHI